MKNFSFLLVIILFVLSSCASEQFHYDDGMRTLNVKHDLDFKFTEGDELGVYTQQNSEDWQLVGTMTFDPQTGNFIGKPGVENGEICRIIYNNCGTKNVVCIPSTQSATAPVPMSADIQWEDNAVVNLSLNPDLAILRIDCSIDSDCGEVIISSNNSMSGHFDLLYFSEVEAHSDSKIKYDIEVSDILRGYIDIVLPAKTYTNFTICWKYEYSLHEVGFISCTFNAGEITYYSNLF